MDRLVTQARKWVSPSPPEPISPVGIKEQDAPLISRLPPELRRLIWEAYVGRHHAVHVYFKDKRLRAQECLAWDGGDTSRGPHYDVCGRAKIQCNHLRLLLTCKTIYFEYITTLYRETSFDFSHGPGSVAFIPKHLPASHVALISQVNLDWELYHPLRLKAKKPGPQEVAWAGIWDGLEAMEGLEWLRVELRLAVPPDAPEWTGLEWTLWEAIRKVTRPSHFKLILPFPAAAETREETLPCKITRRVVQIPGLALN